MHKLILTYSEIHFIPFSFFFSSPKSLYGDVYQTRRTLMQSVH